MLKWSIRTAAFCLAAVLLLMSVNAAPTTSARAGILIDADTGEILYEHNANTPSLIASTTKIMTAVVVLEHLPLQQVVKIPNEAVGIEGSSMYLKAGETLSVQDLLYGMMLHSGNDAAVALALICAGSVEEFVDLMNLKAQKLGLKNTHFENPNGLDGDTHYSSAYDLAALTRYALKNDDFAKIVSTPKITIGGRTLTNHNRLLWSCEGCIGVKTGYTKAAGRILVSAAERNGRKLIAVTIHDGDDWKDHTQLYEYGFSLYKQKTLIRTGEPVARIALMQGMDACLIAGESVDYFCAEGEEASVQVDYPQFAFEKGEAGSYAGLGSVYLGDRKIATIRLLWGDSDGGENTEDHFGPRDRLSSCG